LDDLARAAVEEIAHAERGRQFRVQGTTDRLFVLADALRIERVLANLLSNAVKYSPPGSEVTVSLERADTPGGSYACLSVRDYGMGIPVADLARIFERFQRASNVAGRIRGTGLGLWGARRLVEQHGGTLTAQTEEGVGSVFTMQLPLATDPEDSAPATNGNLN